MWTLLFRRVISLFLECSYFFGMWLHIHWIWHLPVLGHCWIFTALRDLELWHRYWSESYVLFHHEAPLIQCDDRNIKFSSHFQFSELFEKPQLLFRKLGLSRQGVNTTEEHARRSFKRKAVMEDFIIKYLPQRFFSALKVPEKGTYVWVHPR